MKQFKIKYKTVLGITNTLKIKSTTFDTTYKKFRQLHPFAQIYKIEEVE